MRSPFCVTWVFFFVRQASKLQSSEVKVEWKHPADPAELSAEKKHIWSHDSVTIPRHPNTSLEDVWPHNLPNTPCQEVLEDFGCLDFTCKWVDSLGPSHQKDTSCGGDGCDGVPRTKSGETPRRILRYVKSWTIKPSRRTFGMCVLHDPNYKSP